MGLSTVFRVDGPLCYGYNVKVCSKNLVDEHITSECTLFLESLKRRLKAVFLHYGNIKLSLPIAHSVLQSNLAEVLKSSSMPFSIVIIINERSVETLTSSAF